MNLSDFFRKIIFFFKCGEKGAKSSKKEYSVRTENIRVFLIPYSVYLVVKKYGWAAFFYKSIKFTKLFFRKILPTVWGKIKANFFYLTGSFRNSLKEEGLRAVLARTTNYVLYGKGTLAAVKKVENKNTGIRNKYLRTARRIEIKQLRLENLPEISFRCEENPEVSIIIPVFNKWHYTYNCLKSIKENVKSVAYEVIVVDNASSDETPELFKKIKNVVYVRNDENLNFVGGNNQGFEKARGKYVVCLNNDTYVLPNWIETLKETFEENEKIGLVGSKLIYPDRRLQEAGGIVWKNESARNFGRGQNPDDYEFNYLKDVDYCSAASIMVKADVIKELGGFDAIYQPAYFEDTDLAFRVRKMGLRTVYQPKSELIHFEGVTAGTDTSKGFKKYQEVNKRTFFERWKDVLEKENLKNKEENVFLARDRSANRKVMLFMDNNVPTFDQDAGSFIAFEYLKAFRDLGYKIVFWPHNLERLEPYVSALQQAGIEVVYGNVSFKEYICRYGKYFSLAVLSRPHVSQTYIDSVKNHSKAKILYMAHDLHFLREMRAAEYGDAKTNHDFEKTKKDELGLMRKSDATLVFSDEEEKIIRKDYPDINIVTIPWIEHLNAGSKKNFDERKDLLFLGGFRHPPNADAVIWFHESILPLIKKEIPDIHTSIVGSKATQEVKKLDAEGFKVIGFVEDDELAAMFNDYRIFISPLRFGAGFKGKIAKSMSNGLPVVTTSIGAEGIGVVDAETAMIADDPEDFAKKTIELYENEDAWNKIAKNAVEHVAEKYSPQAAQEKIKEIVAEM